MILNSEQDLHVPPIDVCAICADIYCDGVACIAALNPDDKDDQPKIEVFQSWVRRGRAAEIAEAHLARSEGRR